VHGRGLLPLEVVEVTDLDKVTDPLQLALSQVRVTGTRALAATKSSN
jgi:hypothetical protein